MKIHFQVLTTHYIHSSNTFFPPRRPVIGAKRTGKLLITSLLILRNGLLEISKGPFLKIKRMVIRSLPVPLVPITGLLGGKKIISKRTYVSKFFFIIIIFIEFRSQIIIK